MTDDGGIGWGETYGDGKRVGWGETYGVEGGELVGGEGRPTLGK